MKPGDLLHERYRIIETLGRGGMGAVYRGVDDSLGVQVAVKENLFEDEEYTRQFRREAVILANLRHPNLPRVTDHFEIEGQGQYLVMDYIEGEDLKQRMDRLGVLDEKDAVLVGVAICDALAYLHTLNPPVLHRDIKPSNIKVTPTGQVYLVDFGLAKIVEGSQETTTGARGLTPGFSPPEQYGSARTDARSDIFSLAATLYAALCGSSPEEGLSRAMQQAKLTGVRQRNPKISPKVAEAIERALAVQPNDRYQQAEEFKQALLQARDTVQRDVAAGKITVTPAPPAGETATSAGGSPGARTLVGEGEAVESSRRRMPWFLALGLIGVIGLVCVGAIFFLGPDFMDRATALLAGAPTETAMQPSPTAAPSETARPAATATPDAGAVASPQQTASPAPSATSAVVATPLGGGGQIAFASQDEGARPQIYLINVDGSGLFQVTDDPLGACQPDWSPDGTRLVFVSPCRGNRDRYEGSSLFLVNADGSGFTPLPSAPGGDYDPAWSPDGTKIAFTSLRDSGRPQIWILDLESNQAESLSNSVSSDYQPAWSPDGEYILFLTTGAGPVQIMFMESSGFNARRQAREFSRYNQLTNFEPTWSPDGESIVYNQMGSDNLPYVVGASWAGGTSDRGWDEARISEVKPMREPDFSPDGFWLATTSNFEGDGKDHDIYIMLFGSGVGLRQVTTEATVDFDPAWRPFIAEP